MIIHLFDTPPGLPIFFLTCASFHRQENIQRKKGLIYPQLLFVLDGNGVLTCGTRQMPLRRGNAFFLAPGVAHSYESLGDLTTAWVTWSGNGWHEMFQYIGKNSFVFAEHTDVDFYREQLALMEEEYHGRRREGRLSSLLYSLILSFFEEQRLTSSMTEMERVLQFMEENFYRKISLDELVALCYCSKSTFCKRFRETFGCSSFEKLVDIRLRKADVWLKQSPNESVEQIASACGFDDVSYFCKAYKQKFGMTPGKSRRCETV